MMRSGRITSLAAAVALGSSAVARTLVRRSHALAPLSPGELVVAGRLRRHVTELAGTIGPRNLEHYAAMHRAAAYIHAALADAGYAPAAQVYRVGAREVANIEARHHGGDPPRRVVVIGAHYDSIATSPGANDNASGVAVLIELARLYRPFAAGTADIRFVAFANEEPPHFMTPAMGSLVYAGALAARGVRVAAMLSLETMGYYSDEPGSQQYPEPFSRLFPNRGNFLAMVSNFRSTPLLRTVRQAFTGATSLPVIASPAPERVPGVGWSDHWSFWRHGYPAIMLTDTAPYRYPHYHSTADTPDKLDYEQLARVATGCLAALRRLAA